MALVVALSVPAPAAQVVRQVSATDTRVHRVEAPVVALAPSEGAIARLDLETAENPSGALVPYRFAYDGSPPQLVSAEFVPYGDAGTWLDASADGLRYLLLSEQDLTAGDPDGGALDLYLIDASGTVVQLPVATDSARISGDGQTVAYLAGGDLYAVDADGTDLTFLASAVEFHIDDAGERLIYLQDDGTLFGIARDGSNLHPIDGGYLYPRLSGDGQTVFSLERIYAGHLTWRYTPVVSDWTGARRWSIQNLIRGSISTRFEIFMTPDGDHVLVSAINSGTWLIEGPSSTTSLVSYVEEEWAALAPDGTEVAAEGGVSGQFRWVLGDEAGYVNIYEPPLPELSPEAPISISRDGARGAYHDPTTGETIVVDLDVMATIDRVPGRFALSPDGLFLNSGAVVQDVGSGTGTPIPGGCEAERIQYGANGILLLTCSEFDHRVGTVAGMTPLGCGPCNEYALSGDGEWMVWRSPVRVRLARTDGSDEIVLPPGDDPGVSHDGSDVVFVDTADLVGMNGDGNREIFLFDATTELVTQVTDTVGSSHDLPRFTDDDTLFYFRDGSGRRRDLVTGEDVATLLTPASSLAANGDYLVQQAADFAGTNPELDTEIWLVDNDAAVLGVSAGPPFEVVLAGGLGAVDVIRGDLAALDLDGTGGVDLGAVFCVAEAAVATVADDELPLSGDGFFYLARAAGTYGSSSAGEARVAGFGDCDP